MSPTRELKVFIDDIWECVQKIKEYTEGVTRQDFTQNTEKQDAVIRRLEVIGEAVKNLPDDFKDKYTDVPWRKMAGMRDIIIHEYFGVSVELIWRTATRDIPDLKEKIQHIRQREGWG